MLTEPEAVLRGAPPDNWFAAIADQLLNGSRLLVQSATYRLVEIEFYYHAAGHADPFTHADSLQYTCGRWYFHRTRGTYRGGSFKGIDLTFGGTTAFGGILIRGIETPDGALIDGPSLCVDHLLAKTGMKDAAALDRLIAGRLAWDQNSPLTLVAAPTAAQQPVLRSARVGLSLKRAKTLSPMPRFLLRPYRFLTEPRRSAKGKLHMALALHAAGTDPEGIQQLTGCTRQALQRYLSDFEAGRTEHDPAPYFGIDLTPRHLCRLHGAWHTRGQADW